VNNIIEHAHEVCEYFYNERGNIDPKLFKEFQTKIRKALLVGIEKKIINNWRYHLNYFILINKLLKYVNQDDSA